MRKLLVLLAMVLAATSVTAAPAKKVTKPVVTKKAPAAKKRLPPTSTVRPVVKAPEKVTRKAVLSKGKK